MQLKAKQLPVDHNHICERPMITAVSVHIKQVCELFDTSECWCVSREIGLSRTSGEASEWTSASDDD